MANLCHFNVLFTRNVPHILEKIFLSLDLESYANCQEVSSVWKNLLTSENYLGKAKMAIVKGFEGWSLAMMRDFLTDLDYVQEKLLKEGLKEKNLTRNGTSLIAINSMSLLLDMWRVSYPETEETEQTLLSKIKHVVEQEEILKKVLMTCGLRLAEPRRSSRLEENRMRDALMNRVFGSYEHLTVTKRLCQTFNFFGSLPPLHVAVNLTVLRQATIVKPSRQSWSWTYVQNNSTEQVLAD